MNKYARNIVVLLFALVLAWPPAARAVSYSTIQEQREEQTAKGVREKGETVCLFQSGTPDVKSEIKVNDLLVAYRETETHNLVPVGKLKVLSFVGTDYLKAVVVEGEVMTGDIAKKGDVASLVISHEDKCK